MDDVSMKSLKDRITPRVRKIVTYTIPGVVAGSVMTAMYLTKYKPEIYWLNISMESVDFLKKNGQGVIGFVNDVNPRQKFFVALPDKVV